MYYNMCKECYEVSKYPSKNQMFFLFINNKLTYPKVGLQTNVEY